VILGKHNYLVESHEITRYESVQTGGVHKNWRKVDNQALLSNECNSPTAFKVSFNLWSAGIPGDLDVNVRDLCFNYMWQDEGSDDPING